MSKPPTDRQGLLKTNSIAIAGGIILGGGRTVESTTQRPAQRSVQSNAVEITNRQDIDAIRDDPSVEYLFVADLNSDTDGYGDHADNPDDGWKEYDSRSEQEPAEVELC